MRLVLAVPYTEPKDIINIFSQIEGIAFKQNKIVVNSIMKINVVMNDLNILSSHLTFLV